MNKTLAMLLFVVAVSGCLGRGGATQGAVGELGVVTTVFEPDLNSLQSEDRFTMFLELENTGGTEARDIVAFIHGVPIGTDSDAFAITSGDNPDSVTSSLIQPDEVARLPGDITSTSWDMRAPDVPRGILLTYEPRVRVLYRYKTTAVTTVTALTDSEYRRLRERGEQIPGQSGTLVSKGPLGVTIND